MNPAKVNREQVKSLLDLPNVGSATVIDLQLLGIHKPSDLKGKDPFEMHERLCTLTKVRHDPCVIDIFLSIVSFANGEPPKPWWNFTEERKRRLSAHQANQQTNTSSPR